MAQCKMRYREQRYECGQYLEVNVFPVWQTEYSTGRTTKRKPTRTVQEKLNQHNAEKSLTRKINSNFSSGDIKCELTYAKNPETVKRAKKDIGNFFARINRLRAKKSLPPVKYIYSLEQGEKSGRIHFHVIMSGGLSLGDIMQCWKKTKGAGYVDKCLPLMFGDTGCTGIAKYFCKQRVTDGKITSKRYVSSHNCIAPKPKNRDYKFSKRAVRALAAESENRRLFESLYPGYCFVDCNPFFNDVSGLHYLYVRMYRRDAVLDIKKTNIWEE